MNNREFLSFADAKKYAQSLNLKNQSDWIKFSKQNNQKSDLPQSPSIVYKNNGWISWCDFLDINTKTSIKNSDWVSWKKWFRSN